MSVEEALSSDRLKTLSKSQQNVVIYRYLYKLTRYSSHL